MTGAVDGFLLPLLLGSAATAAAAGLFLAVLSHGLRGWPLLAAGLLAGAGLWAALPAPEPAAADGPPALVAQLALLLFPALLPLAALEAAWAARAPVLLRLGLAAGAGLLAVLGLAAGLAGLLDPADMPDAAAVAGLVAAAGCLSLLPFAPAIAIVLVLAGAVPGLALLFAEAAGDGLPVFAAMSGLWLLLLALLLVRRLDARTAEALLWEQAEAEVGAEADRRVAQALSEEVNERGRLEDRLIRATTIDPVSGLATRAHFLSTARALYRQQQESGGPPCAVAVVAVDELREINAYYGFKGGDATLAAIGRTIREQVEEGEVPACRWSGSRFCIWLAPRRGQSAVLLAERVRGILSTTGVPLPEGRFQVTVSVGVAEDRERRGLDHVILAAEAALRQAMAAGGNRVTSA